MRRASRQAEFVQRQGAHACTFDDMLKTVANKPSSVMKGSPSVVIGFGGIKPLVDQLPNLAHVAFSRSSVNDYTWPRLACNPAKDAPVQRVAVGPAHAVSA